MYTGTLIFLSIQRTLGLYTFLSWLFWTAKKSTSILSEVLSLLHWTDHSFININVSVNTIVLYYTPPLWKHHHLCSPQLTSELSHLMRRLDSEKIVTQHHLEEPAVVNVQFNWPSLLLISSLWHFFIKVLNCLVVPFLETVHKRVSLVISPTQKPLVEHSKLAVKYIMAS